MKKTPIIPVELTFNMGAAGCCHWWFMCFKKRLMVEEIGDSCNDDAGHISQAAWMHGMRKSLSLFRREPRRRHRCHGRGQVVFYKMHRENRGRTFIL